MDIYYTLKLLPNAKINLVKYQNPFELKNLIAEAYNNFEFPYSTIILPFPSKTPSSLILKI